MTAVGNSNSPKSATHAGRRASLGWWLIGLALSTLVLLWLGGDTVLAALCYDRVRIQHGEYWRLMTGHWVHGGFGHMALNALGATILTFLFARTYSVTQWLWVLAASVGAIDLGFWLLEPQLGWYVGASGVLQGVLAAGAVGWWRRDRWTLRFLLVSLFAGRLATAAILLRRSMLTLALWGIFVGKLWWEQTHGAIPLAGEMPVIVNAHLYGALGGGAVAIAIELRAGFSRRRAQSAPL